MTHIKIGVLGALAAIAVGCNKEDDTSGGVSLEAAPEELAKAICPKAYTCCVASQLMGNEQAGTDEPSCEAKTTVGFRNQLNGLKKALENKRARYRGDKMEACITYLRSATCESLNRTNHFSGLQCEPWVEPLVALGGKCGNDYECMDSYCAKEPMALEGTCKMWPGVNESCATVRCGKGLVCDESKTCHVALAEGATCSNSFQCASGNCSAVVSADKSCAPPPANQCFYSSACSYGRSGRLPLASLLAVSAFVLAMMKRSRKRGTASGAPPI